MQKKKKKKKKQQQQQQQQGKLSLKFLVARRNVVIWKQKNINSTFSHGEKL